MLVVDVSRTPLTESGLEDSTSQTLHDDVLVTQRTKGSWQRNAMNGCPRGYYRYLFI